MMRHLRRLVLPVTLLSAGCFAESLWYRRPPAPVNPFPRRIAVAPALNLTSEPRDAVADAEALAAELSRFRGVEVVWPRQWNPPLSEGRIDLRPLLEAARAAGAEAVLVPAVTAFSPYPPPKLGISLVLYPVSAPPALAVPYDRLMEAGRPLRIPSLPEQAWLGSHAMLYDARNGTLQDRLKAWGLERRQSEADFDWKRALYDPEEFRAFAFNESVRMLFEAGPVSWGVPEGKSTKSPLESSTRAPILTGTLKP